MRKLSINKTNNAVRKQPKDMNRYFTEENMWMTNIWKKITIISL